MDLLRELTWIQPKGKRESLSCTSNISSSFSVWHCTLTNEDGLISETKRIENSWMVKRNEEHTESEVDSCFGIMRVVIWKTLFFCKKREETEYKWRRDQFELIMKWENKRKDVFRILTREPASTPQVSRFFSVFERAFLKKRSISPSGFTKGL